MLSGKKRSKVAVSEVQENGDEDSLVNGHKSEKLLNRRSRRSDQRLPPRSAVSAPHASSPIHSYIHSPLPGRRAARPNGIAVGARLYRDASKRDPAVKKEKLTVAEHLKVVKHPAPFRWISLWWIICGYHTREHIVLFVHEHCNISHFSLTVNVLYLSTAFKEAYS